MPANYGLINNMASGLREGLITYQTMSNIKQQQKQNQLTNNLALAEKGYTQDDNGNVTPTEQHQNEMQLKGQQTSGLLEEQDPDSERSKRLYGVYKNSLEQARPGSSRGLPEKMSAAEIKEAAPMFKTDVSGIYGYLGKQAAASAFAAPKVEANTQRVHQNALNEIEKDPTAKSLLTTYQNLDNAKKNFEQGGSTPQEFSELQQAVRSNLGLKGGSGVGERQETYLKSLGLNASSIKQFLTGDPQDVKNYSPEMVAQVSKIVDLEKDNKRMQAKGLLDTKAKGHASFYKQHPDIADDYESTRQGYLSQFGEGSPADPQAPQSSQSQTPLNDPKVDDYAKQHGLDYNTALKLLQSRGYGR